MSNTNNNISNPLNGCEVNRIPKIQFKETPKDKNASDYLEVKYSSGKKMVYSGYNVIDEPTIKEEGSMTRSQFEKLYSQLSTKTEQRISDMLVSQTKQMLEIKSEIKQEINEFKSEMNQKFNEFTTEINQKFDNFKVEIRTEMNQKFDLVFATMESNQAQTNDRLDRIEQDIKMLKSFHEEDIKKYKENKSNSN